MWGDLTASRRAVVDVALATPLRQSGATAVPGLEKSPVYGVGQSAATDARVVVGIRVEPEAVDVVGRLRDVPASTTTPVGVPGTALAGLSGLPDNVLGAMSVSGLGAAAGDAYTKLVARSPSLVGMLSDAGVDSAADVRALLGSVATVGVEPTGDAADPMALLSVTSADPARGLAVAKRLESSYGTALGEQAPSVSTSGGRLLIRFPAGAKPAAGSGSLSSSGVFRAAVPDAGSATSIAFIDVQQVLALDPAQAAADGAKLKPIAAIGLSTTAGVDPGFHLRITLR